MKLRPVAFVLLLILLGAGQFLAAQSRVDLTAWQTPVRNQGSRTTCIVFAATAALEARYRRLGLTLDLSEEFVNYLRKMFWLTPDWSQLAAGGADRTENQLGHTGGGNGGKVLEWLTRGMAVPRENVMPYRSGYNAPYAWNDPYWDSQQNVNTWNLDPVRLPRSVLTAGEYYYGTGFQEIANSQSATQIEAALQNGYEVVWDFIVAGDRSGSIWHAAGSPTGPGHSMLIVGYDRTAANSNDHYFIVKNSWGATSNPGGYTYIGYDYLVYGRSAAIITGAAAQPKAWPELALLGRRNICFDGWRGTLDVYHLPGIAQFYLDELANGVTDRRVGTFYDHNGVAHRVNGLAYGRTLHFWIKGAPNENMRWDEARETPTVGRSYVYTIVDLAGDELAGRHHDNPGTTPNPPYGGYARRPSTMTANDGFLQPVFPAQPNVPEQYFGEWELHAGRHEVVVRFDERDDTVVPAGEAGTWAGLKGSVVLNSTTSMPIIARVRISSSRWFRCEFVHPTFGLMKLQGWMLAWQRGVVAGLAEVGTSPYEAFYMVRTGDHLAGAITGFGSACGPINAQPYHRVRGLPELGKTLIYEAPFLPLGTPAVLALGLSNQVTNGQQLPVSLNGYGMPGCHLYVDPLVTQFLVAGGSGVWTFQSFTSPLLLGVPVFSQFLVVAPGANQAGLLTSNAVAVSLGGN